MCGSRCAVMTVITVAVRLISHLMCPFPSSSCGWKSAGSGALNSSLSLVHAITAADMRNSCTFIKQTRFSSRAAANKRPQLSIQVRMTAQHNGGERALYSVGVGPELLCWKYQLQALRGKRRAFCLPLLVEARYAAGAFQAIC